MNVLPTSYRRHLPFVIALLLVQFFVPDFYSVYYRTSTRPSILARGGRECEGYVPALPEEKPKDCDVVLRPGTELIEEMYYAHGGAIETRVRSSAGHFLESSSSYVTNKIELVLPGIAFAVFFLTVLSKLVRTRSIFTWQLARHSSSSSEFEKTLLLYAVPIFLSSIVLPLLR